MWRIIRRCRVKRATMAEFRRQYFDLFDRFDTNCVVSALCAAFQHFQANARLQTGFRAISGIEEPECIDYRRPAHWPGLRTHQPASPVILEARTACRNGNGSNSNRDRRGISPPPRRHETPSDYRAIPLFAPYHQPGRRKPETDIHRNSQEDAAWMRCGTTDDRHRNDQHFPLRACGEHIQWPATKC